MSVLVLVMIAARSSFHGKWKVLGSPIFPSIPLPTPTSTILQRIPKRFFIPTNTPAPTPLSPPEALLPVDTGQYPL